MELEEGGGFVLIWNFVTELFDYLGYYSIRTMEYQLINSFSRFMELLVSIHEVVLEAAPRLDIFGLPHPLEDITSEDAFFVIIMYPKSTICFGE